MLEVELKSKELKEFIYLELGKDRNEPIYIEELEQITELQLDKLDIVGEPTDANIYDLVFFRNLKVCYLSNMNISDKELDMLNSVQSLQFLQLDNCSFTNNKKMELNLLGLVINECNTVKMKLYEDIKTLEKLHIVNCKNVDITGISKLSNLSKLYLQNLKLPDIDEVQQLKNLVYLNLNGSEIADLTKIQGNKKILIEYEEINGLYDQNY